MILKLYGYYHIFELHNDNIITVNFNFTIALPITIASDKI